MTTPDECAQSAIHPGDLVASRYRVGAIVDRSRGLLLDAFHTALNQRVTIRVISPALTNAKGVDQFRREAEAASRLESEHATRILDFGKLQDGSLYLVRSHVPGVRLTERLQRRGACPLSEAVLLCLQICEAVQEAHSLGIVLRDLSPANVVLTERRNGTPVAKLTDFGTCKVIQRGTGDGEVSCTKLFGLSASASPEVVRQDRSLDGRADVWSLGCLLYELVTGRPPFQGEDLGLMQAIAHDDPAPPSQLRSNLPGALDGIIAGALAKDRRFRLASPYALAAALRPFASPHGELLIDQIARLAGDYAPTAAPSDRRSGDDQSMAMVRSVGPSKATGAPDAVIPGPPRIPSLPDARRADELPRDEPSADSAPPPRPTTPPPRSLTAPALGLPPLGPADPRLYDDPPWRHEPRRRWRLDALPLREVARGAVLAMPLCVLLFVFVLARPAQGPPAQTVPLSRHTAAMTDPEHATPTAETGQRTSAGQPEQAPPAVAEPLDRPPREPPDFDDLSRDTSGPADPSPPPAKATPARRAQKPGRGAATNHRPRSQFLAELRKRAPPKTVRHRRRAKPAGKSLSVRF